jgi:hypothetical protein
MGKHHGRNTVLIQHAVHLSESLGHTGFIVFGGLSLARVVLAKVTDNLGCLGRQGSSKGNRSRPGG